MSWSVCVCEANCTSVCTMSRFLIKRKIQTRHSIQFIVPHKSQTRAQNTLLRSSIWEGIFRNYLILRQSAAFINCKIKISSVVHRCVDISLKQTHFSDEIKETHTNKRLHKTLRFCIFCKNPFYCECTKSTHPYRKNCRKIFILSNSDVPLLFQSA